MKRTIHCEQAPKPKGAYSHAVAGAGLIFVSGQLAINPRTNEFVEENIKAQTRQALENVATILAAEGAGLDDVLSVTVFLRHLSDFPEMNRVYGEFFPNDQPARTSVAVAEFPPGALIEIDAVALDRRS